MARKPRSTRAWSILVACAMGLVVCIFVAASVVMRSTVTSTRQALSVASNGAPSVRHISAARTHLRREREAASAYVFRSGGVDAREAMKQARRRLEAALAEERSTPAYPGERDLEQRVTTALSGLDRVAEPLQPTPQTEISEARQRYLAFQAAVDQLDDRLAQLQDHNAMFLQSDADHLLAKQSMAVWLMLLLDGISAMLATAVAVLVIAFLRRHLRLIAERNRELELFSARVAHDLMSPLATVGVALGMTGGADDAQAARITEKARGALQRARGVAEALLEFARSGGEPDRSARTAVGEVLEGVIDDARAVAAGSDIEIALEPFQPCGVACTAGVLSVLASNLVTNAIKFMGPSRVRRIEVRVQPCGRLVRVEVRDTGPGYPPDLEKIIFDPYVRASTKTPGLGLGLATVKRLANAHGGNVGVERCQDVGTRFWFELPNVDSFAEPQREW